MAFSDLHMALIPRGRPNKRLVASETEPVFCRGDDGVDRNKHVRPKGAMMGDGKLDEMAGKAKEAMGSLRDDDAQKREGRDQQVEGKLKQAGEKVRDALDDAKDAVKKAAD